jgi:hypothetical protein
MHDRGGGWPYLAGIALIVAGLLRFFEALWAYILPSNVEGALFRHNIKPYGWAYLIVAIILFLSGLSIVARSRFARWVGIAAAAVGGITSVWWMPYNPTWSLAYMGVCLLVIYALVAHGKWESIA